MLQVMMMSMRDSARELLLMLFCFLVMAVFYANIIFYAEYHKPTTFQTPFAGLWWAVVTMTTVGYGDVVPTNRVHVNKLRKMSTIFSQFLKNASLLGHAINRKTNSNVKYPSSAQSILLHQAG
jgi:hypothetical protein